MRSDKQTGGRPLVKALKLAAIHLSGPALLLSMLAAMSPPAVKAQAAKTKSAGLALEKNQVLAIMQRVADWQIAHQSQVTHHDLDWTNAALYIGMAELAAISEDAKYEQWLQDIGWRYRWQPHSDMYLADDIAVSQMYLDMYRRTGDKRMLGPTTARTEWVICHPSASSLLYDNKDRSTLERWSWCDALFMAPPVYAQMYSIARDPKYLEFMDKEYKATYDFLYDKKEKLFFRDHSFFDKKEANGKKVFWGRGNGWVMGGLVKILKELPEGGPSRKFYQTLLVEMSERVAGLQDPDGYWHASLLDPEAYPNPETSGSGFFVYALAYGVNSGLLDKSKYMPVVLKGWAALQKAVLPDGKLGWVQPVGSNPRQTTRDMTEVYGVGAFLLAGSEVYRFASTAPAGGGVPGANVDAAVVISADAEWAVVRTIHPRASSEVSPFGDFFFTRLACPDKSERRVVFLHGGWGKVAAAASTQYAVDRWDPPLIVNLGTCGGFQGAAGRFDVVVASKTVIYDVIERMGSAEQALADYSTTIDLGWLSGSDPAGVRRVTLVSADQDIDPPAIAGLKAKYGAVAADWESGAVAWTAAHNGKRALILRGVTDLVGAAGGEAYGHAEVFRHNTELVMRRLLDVLPAWLARTRDATQPAKSYPLREARPSARSGFAAGDS